MNSPRMAFVIEPTACPAQLGQSPAPVDGPASHASPARLAQSGHGPSSSGQEAPIWWSNAIFFVSVHLLGIYGAIFVSPIHRVSSTTLILAVLSWQLATFGITIGYHRLWSHRAFQATEPLRWALALVACLGFQGSVKWWVLRHRLHHRWTDSEFDPYNAKRGLFFSHMGWIFRKPRYEKLHLVDRTDLDGDPVVRFQHRHYIALSLLVGFVLPEITAGLLRSNTYSQFDAIIWAGFVARLLIWHFTFFINSLAHYVGEQLFDLDITARSSLWLAIFTGGEANHNFHHAFPRDYRNGPRALDWDPSKWMIFLLHKYTPLVPKVHSTPPDDVERARQRVLRLTSRAHGTGSAFGDMHEIVNLISDSSDADTDTDTSEVLPGWTQSQTTSEMRRRQPTRSPLVLLLDGFLIDVSEYASTASHPGGNKVLRQFAVNLEEPKVPWKDAGQAFRFDVNQHTGPAKEKMKSMRVARLVE